MKIHIYKRPETAFTQIGIGSRILAGSIVMANTIKSSGQEIGESYDFETGAGAETGKEFNHEWE